MLHATTDRGSGQGLSAWLALAGLALTLAFAFQGARGLWEPDEGRYAEVAREMLATGDFLTPRLDGRPHYTKPPLTYWAIAASIRAFGRSEGAVRLHLAVSFAATVLLVAALGGRIWDRRTGLCTGLVYATAIIPFAAASVVTPDTLLVLWQALALYAFWRGFEAETRGGRWLWPALTGAALGLAFLTKGPAGLVFLPAMLVFRRLAPGKRIGAAPVLNLSGVLLLLFIGATWFVAVTRQNLGLAGYFVRDEFLGRLAGRHHRNSEWYGWIIYGPALAAGALPWCLFWLRLWRRIRGAGAPARS
jgi:4-amino-4-deoxy-L-arabinose transferase